jgi:hypothetical protein
MITQSIEFFSPKERLPIENGDMTRHYYVISVILVENGKCVPGKFFCGNPSINFSPYEFWIEFKDDDDDPIFPEYWAYYPKFTGESK